MKTAGQTLVEMVSIIAIASLILSGLVTAIIYLTRSATLARHYSIATNLAQEKMEAWQSTKRNNSDYFWNLASNEERVTEEINSPLHCFITSHFSHYQEMDGTKRVKVEIQVSWQEGEQNKSISISSYFSE